MRNSVVIQVSKLNSGVVVHFGAPQNRENVKQVEMQVNSKTKTMVDEPAKLQGSDFNLFFPLVATTEIDKVDFAEIERIMQINGVAHNVTNITTKAVASMSVTYDVVYNEPQKS